MENIEVRHEKVPDNRAKKITNAVILISGIPALIGAYYLYERNSDRDNCFSYSGTYTTEVGRTFETTGEKCNDKPLTLNDISCPPTTKELDGFIAGVPIYIMGDLVEATCEVTTT